MRVTDLREIRGVHHVLIDVVPARQHVHRVESLDLVGCSCIRPEDTLDTCALKLANNACGIPVPAPDVDGADQAIDVGVLGPFLLERLEQTDCLGVLAVPLRHGHIAAVVQKNETYPPGCAELALLGIPKRCQAKAAVLPGSQDRGVVGRLDDGHDVPAARRSRPTTPCRGRGRRRGCNASRAGSSRSPDSSYPR